MLLNDFYHIIDKQQIQEVPVKVQFTIELNSGHPIFDGHFPGNPVVPGVCLTEIIRELTGHIYGQSLDLVAANYIKFISLVKPSEYPRISIEIKINQQDSPEIQAESTIFADNIVFLKFKGTFRS
jgi:3-hydroxyacyl-[acyl-carrier-protein] dehydratase